MFKQTLLSLSLLTSAPSIYALVLESELLNFVDGTLIVWPSVYSIKICQKNIRHFLK